MTEQIAEATATEAAPESTTPATAPSETKPTETVEFWKSKAREQETRAKANKQAEQGTVLEFERLATAGLIDPDSGHRVDVAKETREEREERPAHHREKIADEDDRFLFFEFVREIAGYNFGNIRGGGNNAFGDADKSFVKAQDGG